MTPPSSLLVLLLSSCTGEFGLGADSASSSDSVPEAADCEGQPVCITGISPGWGPKEGGTGVEISGWGFGGEPTVRFGNFAIESITSFGDEKVVVTTPASAVEGSVDITVESDVGSYTAFDGFAYAAEDADTDADADSDSDSDADADSDVTPTGQISGAVEMSYLAYACPDIYGLTDALQFSVAAVFHDPVSGSWYDDLPPQGSCDTSSAASAPASSYNDIGSWAYLATGSHSIPLQGTVQDGQTYYMATGLAQSDLVKNSAWDLTTPDGTEVADVLRTTTGFDSLSPTAIANDCSQAFGAKIDSSGQSFTWAPTGTTDTFILWLQFYDGNSGAYTGELICNVEDSGGATVPGSMLSGYARGSLVVVNMWRRQVESAVNPDDGNTIESAAIIGIVGTGTLR
ncbi:MAG: hypothetical protein GY913_29175 [Proteobacteria bacterium]|nr:hypothetical protein [Pseudomonadota bacterium]